MQSVFTKHRECSTLERTLVSVTNVTKVFWEDETKQSKSVEIFSMISLTNRKNPKHCFVRTDVLQIKFLV